MKTLTLLVCTLLLSGAVCAQGKKSVKAPNLPWADSLFQAQQYAQALPAYELIVKKDAATTALTWNRLGYCYHALNKLTEAEQAYRKALALNPTATLKPFVLSRLARVSALKHEPDHAFEWLEQAVQAGYINLQEFDNHADYESLRADARFKQYHDKIYLANYPCMANEQARQFDFWIGEWDAYVRGTQQLAGHSRIDRASGGCMILENWTSAGSPFEGKSINFVDPVSGKWKQVWVGSGKMPNVSEFLNGEYRDGAMRFEYSTTDAQGKVTLTHFHFYNESPDQVRQLFQTSTDNGATWTVGYDFTYVRKK